jgi:hypothetical protein
MTAAHSRYMRTLDKKHSHERDMEEARSAAKREEWMSAHDVERRKAEVPLELKKKKLRHENDLMNRARVDNFYARMDDEQTLRGVARGEVDPRTVIGRTEAGQQAFIRSRPELFGGFPGEGGGGTRGSAAGTGGGGFSVPPGQAFTAAGQHMDYYADPMRQAALPTTDAAGRPISPEEAQAYAARKRLHQQAGLAAGLFPEQQGVQGPPSVVEVYKRLRHEEAKEREHFDRTLVAPWVDAEGRPVDAGKVKDGKLPDGTRVYRKVSGPDAYGSVREPDLRSVASVGFGPHRQELAGRPMSMVETAIAQAFGRDRSTRYDSRGMASDSDQHAYTPAPGQSPRAARDTGRGAEEAGPAARTPSPASEAAQKTGEKEPQRRTASGRPARDSFMAPETREQIDSARTALREAFQTSVDLRHARAEVMEKTGTSWKEYDRQVQRIARDKGISRAEAEKKLIAQLRGKI